MQPPLIAHVIFELDIGGLETGVINLINRMPADAYRHAIVCVGAVRGLERRLRRTDVTIVSLDKKPGLDPAVYARAWRTFRRLRPLIVHTRNLAALEMSMPAWLAGVPIRIHSEHGRDGLDMGGDYWRHNLLRKLFRPFVHRYLTMSRNLQEWLVGVIGVEPARVAQIYSGVDTVRFAPHRSSLRAIAPAGFVSDSSLVFGAVGRMVAIKDHVTLVRAFAEMSKRLPDGQARARLVIVGDGPKRLECSNIASECGIEQQCWFPGRRDDIPEILHGLDVFCLTSLNEGINNTILEAMASGLPVIATATGGNPELVIDGETGCLVPPGSPAALADALVRYAEHAALRLQHGRASRRRIEAVFSLESMVEGYLGLYDRACGRASQGSAQVRGVAAL